MSALQVLLDEDLAERAQALGERFRGRMQELVNRNSLAKLVRGKGLLNALVINDSEDSDTAWNICLDMRDHGLLAKPTHGNIIRFAPPLTITEEQIDECCSIIEGSLDRFAAKMSN
jgi:ornithine--oxo-acid transaminase